MHFLLNIKTPALIYIFKASSVSFFPSACIVFLLVLNIDFEKYQVPSTGALEPIDVFGYVVFAPIAETAVMFLIFKGLMKITNKFWLLVFANAFFWAGIHGLSSVYWGLCVFFPFVVFSISYLNWKAVSESKAYWITTLTHSVHNLWACLLVYVVELIE